MEEELEALLRRARGLVNEEFRQGHQDRDGKENESPSIIFNSAHTKDPRTQKTETVQEARKRLRQEWDALKNNTLSPDIRIQEAVQESRQRDSEKDVLYGVVAYVEIGGNERHVSGLKNILNTLGASIKDSFTKEVTHVVYKNGSIETYKRAKLLNVHLVSVLWVEACRNSKSKVCERLFPVVDTNDYSNSPRVFRRFMEYQSKHFEYDASIGEIVRKQTKNKQQSLIHNLQKLNIGIDSNRRNATTATTFTTNINKSPPTKLGDKSNTSDESIRLHVSSDDSVPRDDVSTSSNNASTTSITERNASIEDEANARDFGIDTVPQVLCTKNVNRKNAGQVTAKNKDVSPSKRKLFSKRPMQESFVNFSQEDCIPRRVVVPNPYYDPNPKTNTSKKNNSTIKNISVVKTKTPTKKQNDDNQKTGKEPAVAMYNRIESFNNVLKKTQSVFRPPSKYIYSEHKKCPSLVSTSLHSNENRYLKQLVTHLGGFHLMARVGRSTTHVVCGALFRTVNLLKAVARGCWVLNRRWIEDSAAAGRWLNEEQYELVEFSKIVQRSRLQKQSLGKYHSLDIFDQSGFICIAPKCSTPYRDLKELVTLCGGKVTKNPGLAEVVVGEKVASCANCVNEEWIFDSISFGRCKTLAKYHIKESPIV